MERHVDKNALLREIQRGSSRLDIAVKLNIDKTVINRALHGFRMRGVLPPPLPEETRRAKRESVSDSKGGISLLAESYLGLGMTPLEIKMAILFERGIEISANQAKGVVSKSRERGYLRHPSEREKKSISKNANKSLLDIQKKVLLWLDSIRVARVFRLSEFENGTMDRVDWLNWVDTCLENGYITSDGLESRIQASIRASKGRKAKI